MFKNLNEDRNRNKDMNRVDRSLENLERKRRNKLEKERREREREKKRKRKEQRKQEEELMDEIDEESSEKYEQKLKERKKRRKKLQEQGEELEDKEKKSQDDWDNDSSTARSKVAKRTGLLADKYSNKGKPIPRRMLESLRLSNNKKRVDTWINTVGSGISLGMLNRFARIATGDKNIQVNFANVFHIFPYTKVILTIITFILTFFFWVLFFIPLLIIAFGLVLIMMALLDKSGDMKFEGVDFSGINLDGITLEGDIGGTGGGGGDGDSKTATMGKGASISENQYNWVFPIYAPDDVIRYNRGWENRFLKAYGEWRFHLGIDFGCLHLGGNEAEIYAVDDGVVAKSLDGCTANGGINAKIAQCKRLDSANGSYGNFVMIDHTQLGETRSVYAHLAQGSVRVKAGDKVKKGQLIGLCGDTGSSVGRHLHFEVWEGRKYSSSLVDPHAYIGISHFKKCPVGTQSKISKGC